MPDPVITMRDSAREAVEEHCFSRVDVEVGGFLLGRLDGDEVTVEAAQPALTASSEQTHLTFTHEAWAEILDVLDSDFPGLAIVGWYHSHPGFGCFLSDYDIFIQENFFSAPGQHALVVDPLAGTWGQFVAAEGSAREVAAGRTERAAIAGTDDSGEASRPTGRVDKVDLVAASAPGARRRTWPAVVAAAVAAGLVVGGLAWFVGNVQGRDASAAASADRVAAAEQDAADRVAAAEQVATDLEQQLSDAQEALAAMPSPSDEPATEPADSPADPEVPGTDPGPLLLAVGDRGIFAVEHVVERGDTLWDLASRYFGDGAQYRRLLRANPEVRAEGLEPGQRLAVLLRGTLRATD